MISLFIGLFSGAMGLIALALMPYWDALSPEAYRASFQAIGPFLGRVMIPLLVLSILSAGVALFLFPGKRRLLGMAFGLLFAIVPLYVAWHAPVNDLLLGEKALPTAALEGLRAKWALLHWVRTLLGLAAFLLGLAAR